MTVNNTDTFLVERSGTSYKLQAQNLMADLQDTDLMLVERSGTSYKATGLDIKNSLGSDEPTFKANASGSISNGDAVTLNSNGTVSSVTGSSSSAAITQRTASVNAFTNGNPFVGYEPTQNKFLLLYVNSTNRIDGMVGTIASNGTISYGNVFNVITSVGQPFGLVYAPQRSCFILGWTGSSQQDVNFREITISSNGTASVGNSAQADGGGFYNWTYEHSMEWDSNANRICVAYRKYVSGQSPKIVFKSGTLNSSRQFNFDLSNDVVTNSTVGITQLCFDSTNNKVGLFYQKYGSNSFYTLRCVVVSLTSSAQSIGSEQELLTANGWSPQAAKTVVYDPINNVFVLFYEEEPASGAPANSEKTSYTILRINTSSNNFTVLKNNERWGDAWDGAAVEYDPDREKYILHYRKASDSSFVIRGTSLNPVTYEINFEAEETAVGNVAGKAGLAYDTDKNKMIVSHTQYASGGAGQGTHVFSFIPDTFDSNVSTSSFLGFADGSYSNGQEAKIHTHQATNSAQSGLTTNSLYYLQATGNLSTTPDIVAIKAGTASSSTAIKVQLI